MTTDASENLELRRALEKCLEDLSSQPNRSGSEALTMGRELLQWKKSQGLETIYSAPPRLMTATMDDGLGQGLTVIHCFAEVAGVIIIPLGLMLDPETIVAECRRQEPDLLGLTVLHSDTEEILRQKIIPRLPEKVRVITGGPAVKSGGGEAPESRPYLVFNDVASFLSYLLEL